MCGRYASIRSAEQLGEAFAAVPETGGRALTPRYNVAPSDDVYVVVQRPSTDAVTAGSGRQVRVMNWGMVPSWSKDPGRRMINARVETVATKPAFRGAFARRRAIVPADGYYEWYPVADPAHRPRKQPFYFRSTEGSVLAMAGLYEIREDPSRPLDDPDRFHWSCTVITTAATDRFAWIHDRMPLTVPARLWAEWLDPDVAAGEALLAELRGQAGSGLRVDPVSPAVSRVGNDGPDLIAPVPFEVPDAR